MGIVNCPVGALHEKDDTDEVWAALQDPDKYVVVQGLAAQQTEGATITVSSSCIRPPRIPCG